mgnify:CR=1 FL=1
MGKIFTALGLMSGTSGDGVDASIISSNGTNEYNEILNDYFKYDEKTCDKIHKLRDKILKFDDLKKNEKEIISLEKELTIFHAKVITNILQSFNKQIDLVGFHGQTIFHSPLEKVSKQIGDGKLLSQLVKKVVVFNFRQNDIENGGEGAPLTPIFHKLLINQKNIKMPVCILNIGGISNVTAIDKNGKYPILSKDLGPGNCLIDEWIRNNSKNKFDNNGEIAKRGKIDKFILQQSLENFENKTDQKRLSFDTKDFSLGFVRGLNLEDGTATLTDLTGSIIGKGLNNFLSKTQNKLWTVLACGGGRKNLFLMKKIKENTFKNLTIQLIDDFGINGDYIESQAFAYLAIRSYLNLPTTFPETTGCKKPTTSGIIVKNF